ncbi:MAG: hypothetical protein LBR44_07910 [Clostridiales Family XIII bacterium]|jgi:magnesium transporter|nr:hypothetical protein [Clostridiales Family XIII bacterium]
MDIFDFERGAARGAGALSDVASGGAVFVACAPGELPAVADAFGFDGATVAECRGQAEHNHHVLSGGYDFLTFSHLALGGDGIDICYFHLYVSERALVLVADAEGHAPLARLRARALEAAAALKPGDAGGALNRLYAFLLNELFTDYYAMLETLEDLLEDLSEAIVADRGADEDLLPRIDRLRRMAYTSKKNLRSVNYLVDQILLDEMALIKKSQLPHFRSVGAGFRKLNDFAGGLYGMSSEVLNNYNSRLSMKTNDTVNKLTIITLFFAPLTVITGVYGMNFAHMPELSWKHGYPYALLLMLGVSAILFVVMKRKKWL